MECSCQTIERSSSFREFSDSLKLFKKEIPNSSEALPGPAGKLSRIAGVRRKVVNGQHNLRGIKNRSILRYFFCVNFAAFNSGVHTAAVKEHTRTQAETPT